MQITVNGEPQNWREQATLSDLLEDLGLAGKRVAVEHNGDIVPRSQHATLTLNDGDSLEIVQAIGGG